MEKDIVVLDKDDTVIDKEKRVFPEVKEFLERQRKQNRRLIIATAGTEFKTNRRDVQEIADYLEDFFGKERLNGEDMYLRSDGSPMRFSEIYPWSLPPVNKLGNMIRLILMKFRNRNVRPYKNPYYKKRGQYDSDFYLKDLHLLRRHLASRDFERIRMVLISDIVDILNVSSDPETPFILVPPDGSWTQRLFIDQLLNVLFLNPGLTPSVVFDELLDTGKPLPTGNELITSNGAALGIRSIRKAIINIGDYPFILTKTDQDGRIIFESPVM